MEDKERMFTNSKMREGEVKKAYVRLYYQLENVKEKVG